MVFIRAIVLTGSTELSLANDYLPVSGIPNFCLDDSEYANALIFNMDHLSSSSSTGTATYIQQSVSTFHQDVPKQTYTTAGTIYNPNNAQPLQPPVRRGRTLKWPQPGVPASELSLFPKSVLAGLPLKAQSLCNPPISPLPAYSPLQQNYDRAVSPATDHSRESPKDMDIHSLSASLVSSLNIDNMQASPLAAKITTTIMDKHNDPDSSDDEDGEIPGENPLKGLTVKSLHNLASYPNPNQKRAQRALLRARPGATPGATPAPSAGTNGSRSTTPGFGGFPYTSDVYDMGKDALKSPTWFQPTKTDHGDNLKLQTEAKPVRDLSASRRSAAGANVIAPPSGLSNGNNVQRSGQIGGYKSTLATGPGAPLPLTAGPPGQRQYRASTFESTMKAIHNGPQAEVSNDESVIDFRSGPPGLYQTATQDMLRLSGSMTPDDLTASLPMLVANSTPDVDGFEDMSESRKVKAAALQAFLDATRRNIPKVDYERPEKVQQYYPYGLPVFGTFKRQEENWQEQYPQRDRPVLKSGTCWMTDEELSKRNERTNRLFYAGTGELGRSLESVVREAEFRQFKRQLVGIIGDGRPKPKEKKVEYPPISAQEVNRMTDRETAEPFVTMTFSALLKQVEGGIKQDSFHQWKDPASSLVDQSAEGRQSVFGNI